MLKRKDIRSYMRIHPFHVVVKFTCLIIILLMNTQPVSAQYYYKDILVTGQTSVLMASYKQQKVKSIQLTSYESDGKPSEGFTGKQTAERNYTALITLLESSASGFSQLTTTFDTQGRLIKTMDTAADASAFSEYFYNAKGMISKISNVSNSESQVKEREDHLWYYDKKGNPEKMLRIRNGSDTTYVSFVLDEKGNIAEENPVRNGRALPSFFYYYDDQHRLTDIVAYSEKAKRLLPAYVFEYDEEGRLMSMMVIPEGSSDYQKWYYSYSEEGLKLKEFCYNKKKELLGSVEYNYGF